MLQRSALLLILGPLLAHAHVGVIQQGAFGWSSSL
jgi:hypothetical protein